MSYCWFRSGSMENIKDSVPVKQIMRILQGWWYIYLTFCLPVPFCGNPLKRWTKHLKKLNISSLKVLKTHHKGAFRAEKNTVFQLVKMHFKEYFCLATNCSSSLALSLAKLNCQRYENNLVSRFRYSTLLKQIYLTKFRLFGLRDCRSPTLHCWSYNSSFR